MIQDDRDEGQQEPSEEELRAMFEPEAIQHHEIPPELAAIQDQAPEPTLEDLEREEMLAKEQAEQVGVSPEEISLYHFGTHEADHQWDVVLDEDNQPAMMPRSLTTEERRARDKAKIAEMLAKQPDELVERLRAESEIRVVNYVIQNLIPERSVGFIVGESGAKKTFCALQMAISVAKGHHFGGLPVRKGSVLYFAPEDADGVKERYAGWRYSQNGDKPLENLFIMGRPVPLNRERDLMKFAAAINSSPFFEANPPALVIIDTYSANSAGQKIGEVWREPTGEEAGRWTGGEPFSENNNDQAALLMVNAQKLAEALNCGVVILHHSGKDVARGARGASALKANAAFEITLSKHKDRELFIFDHTKAKGSAMLDRRAFRTKTVKLPPALVQAKREAMARMSKVTNSDDPAAWNIGNNDTTLVVINKPEMVKQEAAGADEGQQAEKKVSKTQENALRLAQFVHEYNEKRKASKYRMKKLTKGALSEWMRNDAEPQMSKVDFYRAFEHATKKQILIKMAGDETLTAMMEAMGPLGGIRDNDPRPTDWQPTDDHNDDLQDF